MAAGDEGSLELWRELDAIGRVHTVVKWIMRSDQRRQLFKEGKKENQEIDQDNQLWTSCENLLVKEGGVR